MFTRRQFISLAGLGALGALSGSLLPLKKNVTWASQTTKFSPDVEILLESTTESVQIFKGETTGVWAYRGKVLKGDDRHIVKLEDSYLGPTLRFDRGQNVRIRFKNSIPANSIIHWHGLHVPQDMDGHPRMAISQGAEFIYEFKVLDRAGLYWYHPHPHGRTGYQVYGGMAGLIIVNDDQESELDLPSGEYEIPLVIQDRTFDQENRLVYMPGGMMDQVVGMMGETILVNGRPDFTIDASTRVYRFRILNGSNARTYNLAWSNGKPLTIIGTDGGLLAKPEKRDSVLLGPGERLDVWADFSAFSIGDQISLVSKSFDSGSTGMMGHRGNMGRGMMGGRQRLPNGSPHTIMDVRITKQETEHQQLPDKLYDYERLGLQSAVNSNAPRRFELSMFHMHGLINGRTFSMNDVADDEIVKADTYEIWEFGISNHQSGMMGMQMPHPMHLHGAQFQVLDRSGVRVAGHLDIGWKDTVLLMPGERIQLLVRFGKYPGLFLYHCHNLEHGDGGMMRNYLIEDRGADSKAPIKI